MINEREKGGGIRGKREGDRTIKLQSVLQREEERCVCVCPPREFNVMIH